MCTQPYNRSYLRCQRFIDVFLKELIIRDDSLPLFSVIWSKSEAVWFRFTLNYCCIRTICLCYSYSYSSHHSDERSLFNRTRTPKVKGFGLTAHLNRFLHSRNLYCFRFRIIPSSFHSRLRQRYPLEVGKLTLFRLFELFSMFLLLWNMQVMSSLMFLIPILSPLFYFGSII